ncbi:ATP-binding protein [Actinomadura barringtoniae]|uniref:ATP-binding protein n=1 Tax=Actinomadura barringtoniae TaxID=1427535 RepID=A0A939PA82_9ACTN|nr:ATP-binding protein [Actinomadura barringtoniae]MBO2448815.1 ATP-binding protein [Actinomadura barringtoniae]
MNEDPEIRMTLLAEPSSAVLARELVRYALTTWGFARPLVLDSMLVMSEMVTNAVNAARGQEIRARITVQQDAPLLECWDPSPGLPRPRPALVDSESGRGLLIIAGHAKEYGVRPSAIDRGKVVWALMPI